MPAEAPWSIGSTKATHRVNSCSSSRNCSCAWSSLPLLVSVSNAAAVLRGCVGRDVCHGAFESVAQFSGGRCVVAVDCVVNPHQILPLARWANRRRTRSIRVVVSQATIAEGLDVQRWLVALGGRQIRLSAAAVAFRGPRRPEVVRFRRRLVPAPLSRSRRSFLIPSLRFRVQSSAGSSKEASRNRSVY